jgi:hypothetical protein
MPTGYRILENPKTLYLDESYDPRLSQHTSIINLNKVLFVFQVCNLIIFKRLVSDFDLKKYYGITWLYNS